MFFRNYFLFLFFARVVQCVPFVTKRVSLHNPINIDFSGWKPLRDRPSDDLQTSASEGHAPLHSHFLTVPVAVETDAEHVLSETDLNQIREHVINNWREKPIRSESFPSIKPFIQQLLPKPEVELKTTEDDTKTTENEYTFVKMDKNGGNSTDGENLFHAYFAPRDHVPPEGYIRLTRDEFENVFKNAEILFI